MSNIASFQALYTLLNNSTALKAKVSGVYDFVPEGTSGTYVQIQYSQSLRGRILNETERVIYFDLHIWSDYSGSKKILEVIDIIGGLIPSEWFLEEGQTIFRDLSGWYHGIVTLKVFDR